jgi:23S rRNA pseudouridine1911/1915/1917 synthase
MPIGPTTSQSEPVKAWGCLLKSNATGLGREQDECQPIQWARVASWTISDDEAGERLDRFLASSVRLGSRSRAAGALARGKVFLNEREATGRDAGRTLRRGDVVRLWIDRPGSASRRGAGRTGDLRILYEDGAMLVVDKPAGLLSVPLGRRRSASSAFEQLAEHFDPKGRREPLVVHRIDRDTSGLVVFAKNVAAQQQLKEQFARREPERVYLAIVHGVPEPGEGAWRDRLAWDRAALRQTRAARGDARAVDAVSHYRVLQPFDGAALIEVRLETGKRNQIRIQAAIHGHPLVGERQYIGGEGAGGEGAGGGGQEIPFSRQALHAHRLAFRHPVDGRALAFESKLPRDLKALLARLR